MSAETPVPILPPGARVAVLKWFDERGRALNFRASRDPYAILVSEVMAQQTQISRVVETWGRFLARFPTVQDLSDATPADVLRAWKGMGYDRRALNLRRAARAIVADHAGHVPRDIPALERLPGVGPYTARAVASIAFGVLVGAVDTNVRRVLGRVHGVAVAGAEVSRADQVVASARERAGARALAPAISGPPAVPRQPSDLRPSPEPRPSSDPDPSSPPRPAPRWMQAVADAAVDPDRPGDWTHAVMDIGATLCKPVVPHCDACPLQPWCAAAARRTAGRHAATGPARRTTGISPAPFERTTRWLRGRIVDRLRDADGSAWTTIHGPIGSHDATAVRAAMSALVGDGLLDRDPGDPDRVRLATDG